VLVGGFALAYGCSGDSSGEDRACVPGASQSCAGKGDCRGYQVCNDDGSAFGACDCDAAAASGGEGSTSDSTSTGSSGAAGSPEELGTGGVGGGDGGGTTSTGDGGTTNVGSSSGGGDGSGSFPGSAGEGGSGGGTSQCSDPPTVMILVDASSSMWDNMYWDALRDAVLGAVHQLQSEV